jgi:RNA-directed DNA polymerase
MARYQGPQLVARVEAVLEAWLGLEINRDKTRVVNLKDEGVHLDFLGYTFWYAPDRFGRGTYLKLEPSAKALQRERAKVRDMLSRRYRWKPIDELMHELNRHLRGWANYFGLGQPRQAFRKINNYVRERWIGHLRRRSQRPVRPADGSSWYHLLTELGLQAL